MSWFRRKTDASGSRPIIDDSDRQLVQSFFGDLSKASVAKQLAVGTISGWCSGYVFSKVGKAAAIGVGGSLLILQVACNQGWININQGKVDKTIEQVKQKLAKTDENEVNQALVKVKVFVKQNIFVVGGFVGGFFIGIAS